MINLVTTFPDPTLTSHAQIVLDAIRTRRSIGKVTQEMPPREVIEEVIEAATWAPNHHLTEPWRFVVLTGEARSELGRVMGDVAARREDDPVKASLAAERTAGKPLRAPVIIAVGVECAETVPEIEEIAAGSAAVQNMLLAAHALGLGAIWRSGWIAFEPEVRDHLGLSERGKVLGFVYLGYPAMDPPSRPRQNEDYLVTWRS